MTEDFERLRARYRLRFIEGAQQRIDRGLQLILNQNAENARLISEELHSLADEASLLGLDSMASVARAGSEAARIWEEGGSESAVRVAEHSLHTLSDTLDLLAEMNTGDFTRQAETVLARTSSSIDYGDVAEKTPS